MAPSKAPKTIDDVFAAVQANNEASQANQQRTEKRFDSLEAMFNEKLTVLQTTVMSHGERLAALEQRSGAEPDIVQDQLHLYVRGDLAEGKGLDRLQELIGESLASNGTRISYDMYVPGPPPSHVKPFMVDGTVYPLVRINLLPSSRRTFARVVGQALRNKGVIVRDVLSKSGKELKRARTPLYSQLRSDPSKAPRWVGASISVLTDGGKRIVLQDYSYPQQQQQTPGAAAGGSGFAA